MAEEDSSDDNSDVNWDTDDDDDDEYAITNCEETVARLFEMGFSFEEIARVIEETKGTNLEFDQIVETLVKYSAKPEASSSNASIIDHFVAMGFAEELVIKAIQEFGDDNIEEIMNGLLSYTEIEKMREAENEDINLSLPSDNNNDDDDPYLVFLSSDEKNEPNFSPEDSRLRDLVEMAFSRDEAAKAIERCGENASVAEIIDFICAAQMSREFDAVLDEEEVARSTSKKRRIMRNTTIVHGDKLVRLPNLMIGFGVPTQSGVLMERPFPIPEVARGPPYFYYENVAMAPRGVWATISRHLYGIVPEFVDSLHFCAAARKRGYIHNLPIKKRFQIQPPPKYTVQEAFPRRRRWWPTWDDRTKLNCLLTCIASAQLTGELRRILEEHDGEPPKEVRDVVMKECKKWNLVWVGKNMLAPLEPHEMEALLGFPEDHTRGCITKTDRYKSLGNSFQVDTVAYHLSVLKTLFPNGINVLSLFTGIGGGEVALHRLGIRMKVVVSVEISEVNRNILKSFWEETYQRGTLVEIRDVRELNRYKIEQLMEKYGGFDLVIGGSPCNNLAGGNRRTRNGLEGAHSSLFFDYCRILDTVRNKAARMRR